jgi:hypothetical protein
MNKAELEELKCIGLYQPVFAGDVLSKETAKQLMDQGLAMQYEGDYVLTEVGKRKFQEHFPKLKLGQQTSRSYK